METLEMDGKVLIRLSRGEEVTTALEGFLADKKIHGGTITGLGGIKDAVLGYYDLPTKTYQRKTISGNLELIHYGGNITLVEGKPFIHAHAVVSGPDFKPYSGHFFEAEVILTGEFVIEPAGWRVERRHDDITGLKLIDLSGGPRQETSSE